MSAHHTDDDRHSLPNVNLFEFYVSPGVNLIKLLNMQFTSVAIVLEPENNSYTCKLHM